MSIWSKFVITAVSTAVAAGVVYFLKQRSEDEAYDIDEFDEDFEDEEERPIVEEPVRKKPQQKAPKEYTGPKVEGENWDD